MHCIAIEDSKKGAESAKNAGMVCVVVGERHKDIEMLALADASIPSLHHFNEKLWRKLSHLIAKC